MMLIKNVRWEIAFGTVLVAIILEGSEKNEEYIPSPDAHRIDAIGVALKCSGNRDCDTGSGPCACSEFQPCKVSSYMSVVMKKVISKKLYMSRGRPRRMKMRHVTVTFMSDCQCIAVLTQVTVTFTLNIQG